MAYETIRWESSEHGVGRLTLDRPESLNAWTEQLGRDLGAVLAGEAADPSVRAVLITGAGRGFSSGADLRAAYEPSPDDGLPNLRKALKEVYNPVIVAIRELPKPVVAAVNGPAAGIGCSLAMACDLVLVAESAFLRLAFIGIGLVPDGGSTVFVPARAGKARAAEMTMLGERVSAAQALEWGLVNAVHPDDALVAEAEALTTRLAAGPTHAHAASKRLLNAALYPHLRDQLDLEAELQHELTRTTDFVEGVTAFAEKRPPALRGA